MIHRDNTPTRGDGDERVMVLGRDRALDHPMAQVLGAATEPVSEVGRAAQSGDEVSDGHALGTMTNRLSPGNPDGKVVDMRRGRDGDAKAVGQRLKLFRKAYGYRTVAIAAGLVNMERARWSNWEIGLGLPPVATMMELCRTHPGLSLDWIYLGSLQGTAHVLAEKLRELSKGNGETD